MCGNRVTSSRSHAIPKSILRIATRSIIFLSAISSLLSVDASTPAARARLRIMPLTCSPSCRVPSVGSVRFGLRVVISVTLPLVGPSADRGDEGGNHPHTPPHELRTEGPTRGGIRASPNSRRVVTTPPPVGCCLCHPSQIQGCPRVWEACRYL